MKARFWPDWDEHILTSDRYQNDDGKIYFKEPGDSIFRSEDWLDIDYRLETKSLVNIFFLICFVKRAWFFLSSIIHIIIRTIKCFFVTFNIVVTITMLFIFCKNHTFIPRMRQQRMHFIVYITVSLSLSESHFNYPYKVVQSKSSIVVVIRYVAKTEQLILPYTDHIPQQQQPL